MFGVGVICKMHVKCMLNVVDDMTCVCVKPALVRLRKHE